MLHSFPFGVADFPSQLTVVDGALPDGIAGTHLSRTFGAGGATTDFVINIQVVRNTLGSQQAIFGAYTAGTADQIYFDTSNRLRWFANGADKLSTQTFTSTSSALNLTFKWDSSNSTAADRMQIFVDDVRITAFDTSVNPSASQASVLFRNGIASYMCVSRTTGATFFGYSTEYFGLPRIVIGSGYTYSDFGKTVGGSWVLKDFVGSWGAEGCYMDFADGGNMGNDVSGNNLDWTTSGTISKATWPV